MDTVSIEYRFSFPDGSREIFHFELLAESLELVDLHSPASLPDWTRLSFYQCQNCPLTEATHPYCPYAAKIAHVVRRFDRLLSYERVYMDVITRERVISQVTTAQQGVSSLMGLIIANCGCPHTNFFRPMAHFHLPLANVEETIWRATSMYLVAQYFLKQEGKAADCELDGLRAIYKNIHIVNRAVSERLRAASRSDLPANAVILLDVYAMNFPYQIEAILQRMRQLFAPFFQSIA